MENFINYYFCFVVNKGTSFIGLYFFLKYLFVLMCFNLSRNLNFPRILFFFFLYSKIFHFSVFSLIFNPISRFWHPKGRPSHPLQVFFLLLFCFLLNNFLTNCSVLFNYINHHYFLIQLFKKYNNILLKINYCWYTKKEN